MSSNSTEKPRQEQRPLPAREDTHGSPHKAQRRTDLAASESTPAKVLVTSVASLALILLALVMCGPPVPAVKPGASGFPPILGEPSGCLTGLTSCLLNHVWIYVTPWTVARQAPQSMGFPRQEYWNGLPSPSPGDQTHISCTGRQILHHWATWEALNSTSKCWGPEGTWLSSLLWVSEWPTPRPSRVSSELQLVPEPGQHPGGFNSVLILCLSLLARWLQFMLPAFHCLLYSAYSYSGAQPFSIKLLLIFRYSSYLLPFTSHRYEFCVL